MNTHTIIGSRGEFLAPPQSSHDERPAGPWEANRGAGVRQALAGEVPVRIRELETIERMNRTHPGASWHFVTHPIAGRVLVSVPNDDAAPATPEILAELANGRRS